MSAIKSTMNHDKFKFLMGNRNIKPDHVRKLVSSIAKNNMLEVNPIIVTEDMVVIDGQHRLMACKEMNIPVYYIVAKADLEDVQQLNTNSKSWGIQDFVDSYINQDKIDYLELQEFKNKCGIPFTTAAGLLYAGRIATGGGFGKLIKSGSFVVFERENAEEVMNWVSAFTEYTDAVTRSNRDFIIAVNKLKETGSITLANLKHKLKIYGKKMPRLGLVSDYLRELEDIVNYKAREKVRLF